VISARRDVIQGVAFSDSVVLISLKTSETRNPSLLVYLTYGSPSSTRTERSGRDERQKARKLT